MTPQKRQQLLLIAVLSLVGLFAADKILLTPMSKAWDARAKQVDDLRKKIGEGKGTLQREDYTRRRWNEMRKNTLPLSASAAEQELLKAFDKWSQESRISVTAVRPQWKRGTTSSAPYSTLECRVDAAGSLGALTRFMYSVEKSPLALKVESAELSSRDNNGSQLALALVVTGLRLTPMEAK